MAGDIDMGHARALLPATAADQITLANQIVARRLSVRDAERLVARVGADFALSASSPSRGQQRRRADADLARLETELSDALATKVEIRLRGKRGGQVLIDFADLDQLDGVLDAMRGREA